MSSGFNIWGIKLEDTSTANLQEPGVGLQKS